MGKIVLLDDLTINKIAAGEVIERPASAIKELVENSIDAGATEINVEIKNGGISYIRVTDNGKGIEQDDMEIAFERHATSKIRSAQDLDTVKSMGFRGEALASIAAIAKVTMQSKTRDSQTGNKVIVEGGNIISKEECGCPEGTSITIENLFYNTPVRYKFLRRDFTEAGYIEDVITRIALIHPEISIKLINSGKTVIQTSGNNDIKSVIYGIYGKDIASNIVDVNYEYEDIKITGVIGKPEIARSNRANQLFFVNKRYIKSPILTSGAEQAYKGMMPAGKFAFLVLNLEINPEQVDVNVHPAKLEVRFAEEQKVFRAIYNAIKDTLLKPNMINEPIKNDNINQQTISEWNQKIQEDKIEDKKEEINQSTAETNNIENIEENNESRAKGFFKNLWTKKEENVDTPNLIEQLYQTRKLTVEDENKIQDAIKQTSIIEKDNSYKKENEDIQDEPEYNSKEDVQNSIANMLEKIEQINKSFEENKEQNTIEEEKIEKLNVNEENIEKENTQNEERSIIENEKQTEQNIQETQRFEMPKELILEQTKEDKKQDFKKESNEKFEIMYESIFGKLPKKKDTEVLKENEEKYTIPEAEIEKAENISLFDENKEERSLPRYRFIGIVFDNHIIIELEKELYIIDQQIANEKIIYEQIRKSYYDEKEKDSQLMLLPDIINVNEKQLNVANENIEMFRRAGFTLEQFGDYTIKLSGVPGICMDLDTKALFLEILDEINKVARTEKQEIEEKFLITVAKKISESLRNKTRTEEVEELIEKLLILPNTFVSPSGRPVAIRMTRADIERKFARR